MIKNQAIFKYIAALLLFGSNGIVASYISMSSYEIVFTRTLIGSLFLVLIFAVTGQKMQFWRDKLHLLYLVLSGVAMGTSWMFLYEAYKQIGVSIATLAYYCGPVIVIILSPVLFKEKMTASKLVGFIAVVLGMLFVNGQAVYQGSISWGLLFGILSAFTYAFMVIFNKKAVSIVGFEKPMWQLIISFLTVAIFLMLRQGLALNVSTENLLPVFGRSLKRCADRRSNPDFSGCGVRRIVSPRAILGFIGRIEYFGILPNNAKTFYHTKIN